MSLAGLAGACSSFPSRGAGVSRARRGFTIVSTFFVLFAALASAFVVLLTWPFRWVLKRIFRPKRAGVSRAQRVVIVGLDGQDPELTEKWMNAGLLAELFPACARRELSPGSARRFPRSRPWPGPPFRPDATRANIASTISLFPIENRSCPS